MDQWQTDMQNALQNRDIDTAKDILFKAYFQTTSPSGEASSLAKGNLGSNHIAQVLDELDDDTRGWIQQQVAE